MTDVKRTPATDPIGCALIAAGYVYNDFHLDLNQGVQVPEDFNMPGHWSLPSRMFRFPIETHACGPDGVRTIGVVHPLLKDHPFVLEVSKTLGMDIGSLEASNDCGYSHRKLATWWHAVDLGDRGLWDELLETRRFTTDHYIGAAVEHALNRVPGNGTVKEIHARARVLRSVLAAIELAEPEDPLDQLRSLYPPSPCSSEKGSVRWPVNTRGGLGGSPWALLISVEHGWLTYDRSGYLVWSERGRALYEPEDALRKHPGTPAQAGFLF